MVIFQTTFNAFWPHTCLLCQKTSRVKLDLCTNCLQDLPFLDSVEKAPASLCVQCGMPSQSASHCNSCLSAPPPQHRTTSVFSYQFPVDRMIHAFKYKKKLPFGTVLGSIAGQYFQQQCTASTPSSPQLLIPVPIHRKRKKERGFNQADILAQEIGQKTGIKVESQLCKRAQHTISQQQSNREERLSNVAGVFTLNQKRLAKLLQQFPNLHIAIVDDVITTGATTESLAKLLITNGVKKVDLWSISRAF